MRHNTHKERLDLWQDSMRMARYRQPASVDWYAVTGILTLAVSAALFVWMLYKSVPMVVRLLVATVD